MKIILSNYLDEKQIKELLSLLKQFQDIFVWHKGDRGHYTIGEHTIDTQRLPPCQMTLGRLAYWEETKVNKQIQALVDLGKMRKSALKYACNIILPIKKDGSRRFCGNYRPLNTPDTT